MDLKNPYKMIEPKDSASCIKISYIQIFGSYNNHFLIYRSTTAFLLYGAYTFPKKRIENLYHIHQIKYCKEKHTYGLLEYRIY